MRSDLIAAGMVRTWLDSNAPHLVNGWAFEMTEDIQGFVNRVKTILADIDGQFVTQAAIPKTALAYWNLQHVAVLGGGMPSPFSPDPHQVVYFTDFNPDVVSEVAQLGYPARQVDVRNLEDLKQLEGATTAMAIGLFHLLNDEAVRQMLQNLLDAGFEQTVFNNMNYNVSQDLVESWGKLGYSLQRRTPDDIRALMPAGWHVTDAISVPDFLVHNPDLGDKLSKLANLHYIYRIVRQ
jgi:hypothetical protein